MKDTQKETMPLMCYQVINFPDEKTGKTIKGVKAYLFDKFDSAPASVFVPNATGLRDSVEPDDSVIPIYKLVGKRVRVVDLTDENGNSIFI